MTGRLAEIEGRIAGIGQLGTVVNAMRGIAAARAQQARNQVAAIDAHAGMIAGALGRALSLLTEVPRDSGGGRGRRAMVLFGAEQGFAGAFNERVLDRAAAELEETDLFLIGTRGIMLARERGLAPRWTLEMPAHTPAIPTLAERIVETLEAPIAAGEITRLDAVFAHWRPGGGTEMTHRPLLPFDYAAFSLTATREPPLVHLAPTVLLSELVGDYIHAQLCNAALHAFAAENEARMEAMAGAHSQIERQMTELEALRRRIRQEEITAEIIELSSGEAAARDAAG
ncbi:F0F1 ATP synthase subunit gamma [Zavarzinia aquatilis]|uniref:ATPase n=1 Tax=Zavarzinia aquatilis TaxID=2211142 RepID=A0A317EHI1_9PROT|nr:FoF1 ATP synthase subunit gamma [Zavarzinia aquatilis]PWR25736.1 ATPase [Zavarzinia aquatilis]